MLACRQANGCRQVGTLNRASSPRLACRLAGTPEKTLERWKKLKQAASRAIVESGGTISHQHGVGIDHSEYLAAEKGILGIRMLRSVMTELDPEGRMNPGKLLPEE